MVSLDFVHVGFLCPEFLFQSVSASLCMRMVTGERLICVFLGTGQCEIESRRIVYALTGFDWTAVGSGGRMGLSSYC